jgi:PAS domain S-box-containing protein
MRSIRYEIGFGFIALFVLILTLGIYTSYNFFRMEKVVSRLLEQNSPGVKAAANMLSALVGQESYQVMLSEKFDSLNVAGYKTQRDNFLYWYEQAESSAHNYVERIFLDSLLSTYRRYLMAVDIYLIMVENENPEVPSYYIRHIITLDEQLRNYCLRLLQINQEQIIESNFIIKELAGRETVTTILSLLALALIPIIVFNLQVTKRFIIPTRKLIQTLRKIDRGNIKYKIDFNSNDEIAELVGEFNKMTERLNAYDRMNIQKILAEKRKTEALVGGLIEPIFVVDAEKRLVLINRAAEELTGLNRQALENQFVQDLIKDKNILKLLTADQRQMKEIARSDYLLSVKRDSATIFFKPRQTEIFDEDDMRLGQVTILEDVTPFKNLDRMKTEFISTVSHEFRTPLTSINMTIDILSQGVVGKINPRQVELLKAAKEDIDRLIKMVKDLLDISRFDSGKYEPEMEDFLIQDAIANSLKPLQLLLENRKIKLELNILQNTSPVHGNHQQISWVITNLLNNAVRYTDIGGQISIFVKQLPGEAQVCVADNGRGIPRDSLDKIFDEFYQVKEKSDDTKGSVGLGLAIAKKIVLAHRGRIWVESVLGKGSQFYFSLPFERE